MLLILSENTDIYFNLAAEEYMLHTFSEDVLMLWRSKCAVVCGKHQNICAELHYGYCRKNGIQPARRLTGGGTVYHDLGNINFTFIQNLQDGLEKAIQFRRFLDPVRNALLSLGVVAEYSSRNDLLLDGKKISGNAEHIYQQKKRILHHGTLLFDADLGNLKNTLHPRGKYTDKAVKSVPSEVTNIRTKLPQITADVFLQDLYKYWLSDKHTNKYVFCEKDVDSIRKLQETKYATQEWIVQYSPRYSAEKVLHGTEGAFLLRFDIEKGCIQNVSLHNPINGIPYSANLGQFEGAPLNESTSEKFALFLQELGFPLDIFILF